MTELTMAAPAVASVFDRTVPGIGPFSLRVLQIPQDTPLLHQWVTQPYARYWGMLDASLEQVETAYRELAQSGHAHSYLGLYRGEPAFLLESYDPAHDTVGQHYPVRPGDRGMHFLVAPARQPIAGFTRAVMQVILDFLFADPAICRVVVEPDVRNDKIHVLNRHAGFVYQQEIALPHKRAHLAFCTREHYAAAPGLAQ